MNTPGNDDWMPDFEDPYRPPSTPEPGNPILDRLAGTTKLLLLWQILAAFTTWLLTVYNPWFWIPATCALIGAALSVIELFWILPQLRAPHIRGWRCRRCRHDVAAGRCACTESPSPWEPKP